LRGVRSLLIILLPCQRMVFCETAKPSQIPIPNTAGKAGRERKRKKE